MNIVVFHNSLEGLEILSNVFSGLPFVHQVFVAADLHAAVEHCKQHRISGVVVSFTHEELSTQSAIEDCSRLFPQQKVVYLSPLEPGDNAIGKIKRNGHIWVNRLDPLSQTIGAIAEYFQVSRQGEPPESMQSMRLTLSELCILECLGMGVSDDVAGMMMGCDKRQIEATATKAMTYFGVDNRDEMIAYYEALKSKN